MISMDVFDAGAVERSRMSASDAEFQAGAGETPPLIGKENSERRPHPTHPVPLAFDLHPSPFDSVKSGKPGLPLSNIVSLGRWRAAA